MKLRNFLMASLVWLSAAAMGQASTLVLDDFNDTQTVNEASTTSTVGLTGLPFDQRTLTLSGVAGTLSVFVNGSRPGVLDYVADPASGAGLTILYDFVGAGSVDFTNGGSNDTFAVKYTFLDENNAPLTVSLTSASGSAETSLSLPENRPLVETTVTTTALFSSFSTSGSFDFGAVTAMSILFEPTLTGVDADFTFVTTDYTVAPVPLPAGLPLMLTGLAAFTGLRIRKKRKTQV